MSTFGRAFIAGVMILTSSIGPAAGSLDGEKVRDAILKRDFNTAFGAFKVDRDGLQIAQRETRQMKQLNVNPKMYAATVGVALPKFYEDLGRAAGFVYGPSEWEPELVTLRAGGLIPIARQYPGAREFVEAHHREYPGAELSFHTAAGYGGCQVLTEAIKRAGSLDPERIRDAILKLDFNTVFGGFKVARPRWDPLCLASVIVNRVEVGLASSVILLFALFDDGTLPVGAGGESRSGGAPTMLRRSYCGQGGTRAPTTS